MRYYFSREINRTHPTPEAAFTRRHQKKEKGSVLPVKTLCIFHFIIILSFQKLKWNGRQLLFEFECDESAWKMANGQPTSTPSGLCGGDGGDRSGSRRVRWLLIWKAKSWGGGDEPITSSKSKY